MTKQQPPKRVNLNNGELLARHLRGEPDAFKEFVMLYRQPVYSYLVRLGVPETNRDDLFQDVFLKIHRFASSYNSKLPLAPWVFTIVANTTRSFFRAKKVITIDFDQLEIISEEKLAEQIEDQETIGRLAEQIQKLPYKQKEALLLSTIEGIEYQEISKILKVSVNTVKSLVRRARLSLLDDLRAQENISLLKVS